MSISAKKNLFSLIGARVNALSPEESFLVDLQQTIVKLNPREKGSVHYKPSSMNCNRCMYYIACDTDPDDRFRSASEVRITESGSDSHERIQQYVSKMRDSGFECDWIDPEWYAKNKGLDYLVVKDKKEFETKFLDTRYNLSFLCDGIIRYKNKYYILEIKTETSYKNDRRINADLKHRNQSICYSLALGIDDIMWLYENRNICDMKAYHTVVTEQDRSEIIMRIEYVDDCVRNHILPDITSNLDACKYCDYRDRCYRDRSYKDIYEG